MTIHSSPTPFITVHCDLNIGWLTLNRPQKRNAINGEMWNAIPSLIAKLVADNDIRVIVISGAGHEAFAAGADISEFAGNRSGSRAARVYEASNTAALNAIANAAKPVIAMIEGFCIGGGLALALAADIRIAADDSRFALPPARLGLAYPLDGLKQLLACVSPAIAKELIFTARQITAEEALQKGLINQQIAKSELRTATLAMCNTIIANAPLTLKASKLTINALATQPESHNRAQLEKLTDICFESNDYAEGQTAFLEKRKPVFTGN